MRHCIGWIASFSPCYWCTKNRLVEPKQSWSVNHKQSSTGFLYKTVCCFKIKHDRRLPKVFLRTTLANICSGVIFVDKSSKRQQRTLFVDASINEIKTSSKQSQATEPTRDGKMIVEHWLHVTGMWDGPAWLLGLSQSKCLVPLARSKVVLEAIAQKNFKLVVRWQCYHFVRSCPKEYQSSFCCDYIESTVFSTRLHHWFASDSLAKYPWPQTLRTEPVRKSGHLY